jgi:hypothetical protein
MDPDGLPRLVGADRVLGSLRRAGALSEGISLEDMTRAAASSKPAVHQRAGLPAPFWLRCQAQSRVTMQFSTETRPSTGRRWTRRVAHGGSPPLLAGAIPRPAPVSARRCWPAPCPTTTTTQSWPGLVTGYWNGPSSVWDRRGSWDRGRHRQVALHRGRQRRRQVRWSPRPRIGDSPLRPHIAR